MIIIIYSYPKANIYTEKNIYENRVIIWGNIYAY